MNGTQWRKVLGTCCHCLASNSEVTARKERLMAYSMPSNLHFTLSTLLKFPWPSMAISRYSCLSMAPHPCSTRLLSMPINCLHDTRAAGPSKVSPPIHMYMLRMAWSLSPHL